MQLKVRRAADIGVVRDWEVAQWPSGLAVFYPITQVLLYECVLCVEVQQANVYAVSFTYLTL